MTIASFVSLMPPELRIVLADVGSAGGLHGRWKPLRPLVDALLFEPRDDTPEVRRAGTDLIVPFGLGPKPGREMLNITALANMSSTLEPNAALLETYAKKHAHTRIVERIEMPVDTLDAVAAREDVAVDALKVDTQGSELGILLGAQQALMGSVVIAEIEVSFFHRYRDQALAWDIVRFMGEQGFELIELYRLKRYRRRNAAEIGNMGLGRGQRAGRLAYGDAIFVIREEVLAHRLAAVSTEAAEALVLKTMLGFMVYGKPDMAAQLFERFASHVREPLRGKVAARFARLGKRLRGSGVLHHVFDYLARKV